MKIFERIASLVNDYANPVVVKEMRQAVQSRLVISLLLLFLTGNVFAVCMYLLFSENVQSNMQAGQDLFQGLFTFLAMTTLVFVPLYTAVRMTMERNHSNMDLLFITTIPPRKIILGKLWATIAMTGLIYSACLPFITLTYLLRGIDLPSIFVALAIAFLITTVLNMVAIFVGSVQGGGFLRLLLGGILLYAVGMAAGMASGLGFWISRFGVSSMFDPSEAWAVYGTMALGGLGLFLLAFFLAVAAVSPRTSNRMFPTHVYLTVCWGLSLILALTWHSWATSPSFREGVMTGWMVCSLLVLMVIFGLVLAEREHWSLRVKRTIPRNLLGRSLAFLFYTGSAGSVIWCCLLSISTILIWRVSWNVSPPLNAGDNEHFFNTVVLIGLYTWCYGMSGLFLRRMVAPKTAPLVGPVLGLILFALAGTLPLFIANFIYDDRSYNYSQLPIAYVIMNPFIVLNHSDYPREVVQIFVAAWAGFALLVNVPWFRQQWNEFRRHESLMAPVTEAPGQAVKDVEPAVVNG